MSGIGPISQTPPRLDLFIGPVDPRSVAIPANCSAWDASYASLSKFQVNRPVTVTKAGVYCGTAGGNLDIGIFDATAHRLASVGGIANAGVGETQYNLSAPLTLLPGVVYYSAFVTNSGTATFLSSPSFMSGYTGMGGYYGASYPLPATLGALYGPAQKAVVVVFS